MSCGVGLLNECGQIHLANNRMQTKRQPSSSPSLLAPAYNCGRVSFDCLVKEFKSKMPWESRYPAIPDPTNARPALVPSCGTRVATERPCSRIHVRTDVTRSQPRQEASHLPSCPEQSTRPLFHIRTLVDGTTRLSSTVRSCVVRLTTAVLSSPIHGFPSF